MPTPDDSYQVKIYTEQGGSKRVYKSDASLVMTSGAVARFKASSVLAMSEGSLFGFADGNLETEAFQNQFLGKFTITQHGVGDTTGAKSIVPAYGYHVYSLANADATQSILIASASKGMTLQIVGEFMSGNANISIITDPAVGLVVNVRGSDLSSLELSEAGYVDMICTTDGTWSIVGLHNVIERPSS
jgi:phage-related minor tail protein